MHFSTIISAAATAAALTTGANAAAVKRQNGVHAIDFELFAQPGCKNGSQGVRTIYSADIRNNKCIGLGAGNIKSLSMTYLNEIGGCYFTAYPNQDCSSGGQDLELDACIDATNTWKAYSIYCGLSNSTISANE